MLADVPQPTYFNEKPGYSVVQKDTTTNLNMLNGSIKRKDLKPGEYDNTTGVGNPLKIDGNPDNFGTQSAELIVSFDDNVIKKLIDRNSLDATSLRVFDLNLSNWSLRFKVLVSEARKNGKKLDGKFGAYIANIIALRQIIAKQTWVKLSKVDQGKTENQWINPDSFLVDGFFNNFLGININEESIEDIIDHRDANQCYCNVPLTCKKILNENYQSFFQTIRGSGLDNAEVVSAANI